MNFVINTVERDKHVIMLACAKGSEENTIRVCVRITEENTKKVYELLMTNDVYSFTVNGATGSVRTALENAAEECGRDTLTLAIVNNLLHTVDPTFSVSNAELFAMTIPVHPDFYIIDYCDGDRDDDCSDCSDCSDDISILENLFALKIPLLPLNGRCGRCFDGKLVKPGHGQGMWPWSMCCAKCGQLA